MPRNPEKTAGLQKALGGAVAAHTNQVFTLVVCGADNSVRDGWMFADFLGFSKALDGQRGQKSFYSCFPLKEHFADLKRRNITDIKFGFYGNQRSHIHSYERAQFEQCPPFWTQITPERLLHEVMFWIGKRRKSCLNGDIINIFLICHGSDDGKLSLGKKVLPAGDLSAILAKFQPGVEINVVSTACYSGHIAEEVASSTANQSGRYVAAPYHKHKAFAMGRSVSGRIRSGRFANAVVESLLKVTSPSTVPWTVSDNDNHIIHRLRDITPGETLFTAQFLHSGFDPVTMPLDQLILSGNDPDVENIPGWRESLNSTGWDERLDTPPPPLGSIKWQEADIIVKETLARSLAVCGQDVTPSAQAVAKSEGELCNLDLGYPPDIEIFDQLFFEETNWRMVLNNLYWRSFRQATMWEVFLRLLREDLVSAEALTYPMDLHSPTMGTYAVSRILSCYQFFVDQPQEESQNRIPSQSGEWTTDRDWYVLIRSLQIVLACNSLTSFI